MYEFIKKISRKWMKALAECLESEMEMKHFLYRRVRGFTALYYCCCAAAKLTVAENLVSACIFLQGQDIKSAYRRYPPLHTQARAIKCSYREKSNVSDIGRLQGETNVTWRSVCRASRLSLLVCSLPSSSLTCSHYSAIKARVVALRVYAALLAAAIHCQETLAV